MQLISEALEIKSIEILENGKFSVGSVSHVEVLPVITDIADIDVFRVITANDSVILPRDFDSSANAFEIAHGGEYTLFMSDFGMVYVNNRGAVEVISHPVYNGKTYDRLREESIQLFGDNYVFWNGQVSISPDNSCVAYVSNKGDIQGTWDLYVLDIESGKETLVKNDSERHCGVMQWLDDDHIICSKLYDNAYDIVVVNKDGTEYSVDFSVDRPVLLGAKNGMIAYGDENNDVIYIAQFTNSETLIEIARYELDGTFRIRPGIEPFSPDGAKFAYIFAPSDNLYGSGIVVIDLATPAQENNKSVPAGAKDSSSVLEFDWFDNSTLLISLIDNKTQVISSWLYIWDKSVNGSIFPDGSNYDLGYGLRHMDRKKARSALGNAPAQGGHRALPARDAAPHA
jgi:Tol biopolymer transport system component